MLYLLDGQYAFEGDGDGTNFGTDRRIAQLASSGTIEPHLIVAIDNLGRDRFLEYMPQTIYEQARGELREGIDLELARHDGRPLQSDALLRHLTIRLKPFVDENYRTRPGRLDTAIFGASMAGVMAGAIFVEAQHVFGRGACISPNCQSTTTVSSTMSNCFRSGPTTLVCWERPKEDAFGSKADFLLSMLRPRPPQDAAAKFVTPGLPVP